MEPKCSFCLSEYPQMHKLDCARHEGMAKDPTEAYLQRAGFDVKRKARKATPVFSGVLAYFPKAIMEVARCSFIASEQHNPGTPMRWDRSKSGDELDALSRHLLDAGTIDDDGIRHSAKVAWRALANLEKELEADEAAD